MDTIRVITSLTYLIILSTVSSHLHMHQTTSTTTKKPDINHQDYLMLNNQVLDTKLPSPDLERKRYKDFRHFLLASSRREEDPPALYLGPLAHGRFTTSEERLSAAEARSLLFRGAPQGRPVPLSVDDLLPDRCQMLPFEETIFHRGCENATISTNFCYGLCSSLFVPLYDDVIAMCHACAPTKFKSVAVDLHCPGQDSVRKHIKVVVSCGCVPCESKGGIFG